MRYIGGKSKLAGRIADVILQNSPTRLDYIEPFIGGGSVFGKVAPYFNRSYAGDLSEDLAVMWREVLQNGWKPPENVTEEEYNDLKTAVPSALRGFVGFGGSFGGKWFGGYARGGFNSDGTPRNHQAESARAVNRIARQLTGKDITIIHRSYDQWQPFPGSVIYRDPPYANSQGYTTGEFDSEKFWQVAKMWSETCSVFVSEYAAPPGWEIIWEAEHRQSLTMPSQGREPTIERLFKFAP